MKNHWAATDGWPADSASMAGTTQATTCNSSLRLRRPLRHVPSPITPGEEEVCGRVSSPACIGRSSVSVDLVCRSQRRVVNLMVEGRELLDAALDPRSAASRSQTALCRARARGDGAARVVPTVPWDTRIWRRGRPGAVVSGGQHTATPSQRRTFLSVCQAAGQESVVDLCYTTNHHFAGVMRADILIIGRPGGARRMRIRCEAS